MIALIAGQGALPEVLAAALQDRPHKIYHLEGFAPETLASEGWRIEKLGSFLKTLKKEGVEQVCFAGRIARPPLDLKAVCLSTLPLVPRMMKALKSGDDAALRLVLSFFEEAGLTPVAAHDLVPDLLPPEGVLTGTLTKRSEQDLERAQQVHQVLSSSDVGQGVVVAKGLVLAVEALPGTDWMLESLAASPFRRPRGGLFYKAPKKGQDRRIDMPVIGQETIIRAAQAGLSEIAIEAGGVMVLERGETIRRADEADLALWVVPAR